MTGTGYRNSVREFYQNIIYEKKNEPFLPLESWRRLDMTEKIISAKLDKTFPGALVNFFVKKPTDCYKHSTNFRFFCEFHEIIKLKRIFL